MSATRRIPGRGEEISWTRAYEWRMRRFNLEVILLALSAPNDIDRMVVHRGAARFKIAPQDQLVDVQPQNNWELKA